MTRTTTYYAWRTSRGATVMQFMDKEKAILWRALQREIHGAALAPAKLYEVTIQVTENEIDPNERNADGTGNAVQQEPNDPSSACLVFPVLGIQAADESLQD